ncbi:amonabactin biosynthesis non-ribosomal peptide synthetase AmoF [Caballeronia sp. HLA56]
MSKSSALTSDSLYRTALLRLSPTKHWWYLQVHHIALDGFGYNLLQQTVAARYNALISKTRLPDLPDWQMDRVVEAETHYRRSGSFDVDRAFWRTYTRHIPAPLLLTPEHDVANEALQETIVVDDIRLATFRKAARRAGVDWNAWLLCAIGVWLARQGEQRDLTIGLLVMNRLGTPALGVPCMAMNIVPFQLHIDSNHSPRDLARVCSDQINAIRPHLYYRYGWIRDDLESSKRKGPIFNQSVNIMPFDRQVAFDGLTSSVRPVRGGPVKDLNVALAVSGCAWRLTLEANPNAYDAPTLRAYMRNLVDVLDRFGACAASEPIAHLLERLPPTSILRGSSLTGPYIDVIERIERVAHDQPASTAIEYGERRVDYGTLLAGTLSLADELARRGVTQETRVAILAPRSPEVIAAMLAVLKVGAVIVPLDPNGPSQRIATMLAGVAPTLVIVSTKHWAYAGTYPVLDLSAAHLQDVHHFMKQREPIENSLPAYLMHTSGSTGRPNGVLISRGALNQFVASTCELYGVNVDDRVLQFAPLHFDASFEEIFITLCQGATLVLRDDAMLNSVDAFTAEVERRGISVLDLPTAYWHQLAYALDEQLARRLECVRLTIIGGESALPERVRRWALYLPRHTLLNTYGPTEATIIATSACIGGPHSVWYNGESVPIGTPRAGIDACVVDERMYPVAAGRAGEIVLSGDGLALAYLGDSTRASERFVTLPHCGQRAYRTGDLATLRDGQLYFEGRIDDQIKISGVRIDLHEIENALLHVPDVCEAAVIAMQSSAGAVVLVAFVTGLEDTGPLRGQLAQQLHSAAVPNHWHALKRLPRNANGKIDRNALRKIHVRRAGITSSEVSGRFELEVMAAWRSVLGDVALTPHSNFFDVGGKSLSAMQVSVRLAKTLGRDVPVSILFSHPTVAALAAAVCTPSPCLPPVELDAFAQHLTLQKGRNDTPRLICIHAAEGLAWSYLRLAACLPNVTVDGLQISMEDTRNAADFEALIATYVHRVRALQPVGPYHLLGWSLGGALAYGIAAALARDGEKVATLALMDSYPSSAWAGQRLPVRSDALQTLLQVNGDFDTTDVSDTVKRQRLLCATSPFAVLGDAGLDEFVDATLRQMRLFREAPTPRYHGQLLLFNATQKKSGMPSPKSWYAHRPTESMICCDVDCSHDGMSDMEPMAAIGAVLSDRFST